MNIFKRIIKFVHRSNFDDIIPNNEIADYFNDALKEVNDAYKKLRKKYEKN